MPLLGGLATIVVLIVYQFRAKRPLLTIRAMLTSTIDTNAYTVCTTYQSDVSSQPSWWISTSLFRRRTSVSGGAAAIPALFPRT